MTEDASDMTNNSAVITRYKIVFVGDPFVGKTSIMIRFVENAFKDNYEV
jgi:GTPase SAR1 family protein